MKSEASAGAVPWSKLSLGTVVLAVAVHSLWGGNAVAIKLSLEAFPPMWTAFLRFSIAIVCVALWAGFRGIPMRPKRSEWWWLVLLGVFFSIQIGLMNIGFEHTSGSIGSILMATNPIFAALWAHFLVAGDRLTRQRIIGLFVAFLGAAVVILQSGHIDGATAVGVGSGLVFLSAALLGCRLAYTGRLLQRMDEVRVVLWQMVISVPVFGVAALMSENIVWERVGLAPIAGIVYQGLVVAGLGFMLLTYLMKRYSTSVITSFNFVSPISGVLLSVLLLGDKITLHVLAGVALVGTGLYLVARHQASP
ncbi:MAG TPA: DMT family transporter [Gammaproteobacteria bacterium]|nr:DMT family transporter [Gammaproteobacteria bacterium]HIM70950.1 DMT family transporter [Gammaproteobacteria bacterium]HIN60094.1 DMT family transporter [Gammaproteobacteria bacterium]